MSQWLRVIAWLKYGGSPVRNRRSPAAVSHTYKAWVSPNARLRRITQALRERGCDARNVYQPSLFCPLCTFFEHPLAPRTQKAPRFVEATIS